MAGADLAPIPCDNTFDPVNSSWLPIHARIVTIWPWKHLARSTILARPSLSRRYQIDMPMTRLPNARHRPTLDDKSLVGDATFSSCRRYRYSLERRWDKGLPTVMFIGLNPSTADETVDDPTIRRCIGFAINWGYGSLIMTNLFGLRSTDPRGLLNVKDPIGRCNDMWLDRAYSTSDLVVAAWGAKGHLFERDLQVSKRLEDLHCLGTTKGGHPKHPLYLRSDIQPRRFCI